MFAGLVAPLNSAFYDSPHYLCGCGDHSRFRSIKAQFRTGGGRPGDVGYGPTVGRLGDDHNPVGECHTENGCLEPVVTVEAAPGFRALEQLEDQPRSCSIDSPSVGSSRVLSMGLVARRYFQRAPGKPAKRDSILAQAVGAFSYFRHFMKAPIGRVVSIKEVLSVSSARYPGERRMIRLGGRRLRRTRRTRRSRF